MRLLYGIALTATLAGCAGVPAPVRIMPCAAAPTPVVTNGSDGNRTTRLSVLTYNIEGLGWPARTGRGSSLRQIAERLEAMHRAGTAPDVVLFQEVFSGAARRAVAASGYPALLPGPGRTTGSRPASDRSLPGRRQLARGEIGLKLVGSGLLVASRYPILTDVSQAYGRRSCAGLDCLANKGIMAVAIAVPGVPAPVYLYNTHMNARGASRVSSARNLAAHDRQAREASAFVARTLDPAAPVVFGGDFNMRRSVARWEHFTRYKSLTLVHRVCAEPDSGCDVRMSWDGDAPWMDTQDLQFFGGGEHVAIRPVRVEAMFDGGASGPRLSDHDGFLVTYELIWPAGTPARAACGQ